MNSEQVLVDKKLLRFSLNRVLESEMLQRNLGVYNSFLKSYEFSTSDYIKINEEINKNNISICYYKLCDLLSEEYTINV